MGVAASLPRRSARHGARLSIFARLGALRALVFICVASFVVHALAAFGKATPDYYPDEYMYSELGRSIAEGGRPLIRGADSSFPALLQPILTAPAWTLDDVADAYRLIQLLGALVMSLAAVPVFLLAVRLGVSRGMALGCAALAVSLPALMYASSVLAEPFAYPLFLAAVFSGTIALADRSRRAGLAFVFLAGLAAFARVQFAFLPVCFLISMLFVGIRGRTLARELRAQALPLLLIAAPVTALLAFPERQLGMYGALFDLELELEPLRVAERIGTNAMGLMYASGWILVPGACLGIALALTRARSRAELAFGALSLTATAALLLQASLYGDLDRIQERYFFYAAPLVAIAFCLLAARAWPWRRAHALFAGAALMLSALVPLSGYVASFGKVQSPFLLGVARLEQALGDPGTTSLVVAATVAALSVTAIGASLRPRWGSALVLVLALCFSTAASTFAALFNLSNSRAVRDAYLPAERSWVDESGLRDVVLLAGFARHTEAGAQLFWNRSVNELVLLPGAVAPDSFAATRVRVGRDGTLRVAGRSLRRPLLVDEWAALIELRGARPVASAPSYRLWRPTGVPRLAVRFEGYFRDGWLAPRGEVGVWPAPSVGGLAGAVTFTVTAHPDLNGPATLRISAGGERPVELRLAPGDSRHVELPICAQGPWKARYEIDRSTWFDQRFISFGSTRPRFVSDPAACR
jgi:hypothetical protein